MSAKMCQIHECRSKASVQGLCWPHYRQLNSRYVELCEHLRSLYEEYGPLFERAAREVLRSYRNTSRRR